MCRVQRVVYDVFLVGAVMEPDLLREAEQITEQVRRIGRLLR